MEARQAAELAATDEERRVAALQRAAADRREGMARLHGQVNGLRSRAAAAEEEVGRLTQARADATARADRSQQDFTSLERGWPAWTPARRASTRSTRRPARCSATSRTGWPSCALDVTAAERERSSLTARKEALEIGLNRKDGAGALLAATDEVSGLLGSLAALLSVRSGYETAVAAALGSAADAVAVTDVDAAIGAIGHLKGDDLGRAGLLLGGTDLPPTRRPPVGDLFTGATYAADVVECSAELRPSVERLLAGVVVVDDLAAARSLVARNAEVTAVTREGDVLGAHFAAGGSTSQPSLIEVQAAVDEAGEQLRTAAHTLERLTFDASTLEREREEAQRRADVALAKLHESDATLAAVAEELGQYGTQARNARAEAARLDQAIEAARVARDKDLEGLAELETRLTAAEESPEEEPDTSERERLSEASRTARAAEMEARLALRTTEERARAINGRADGLLRSARAEREARAKALARREQLLREGRVGEAVGRGVALVLARLEESIALAAAERTRVEQARAGREHDLRETRVTLRDLGRELDELVNTVHRDELARAQQRMRIEQLEEKALDDLGMDPDGLVADYGPDQLIAFTGEVPEGEEPPAPVAFDREEQTKRLRTAERALAQLGRINPLALEEFSALEERHKFLTEQLEDLKGTRKDLLDIVREVDARVEQVFTEAYADVSTAFDATFTRLFPGGEGRLVLTTPDDMLNTGIEVEARPAGKKVKRLSLLSGGERSLVAVAFLVSLFKARPSPFYILDEVEAALDDTNLGRLLQIYEELRENSQLLVITHQKRTMEVGDALYGVTMRGDGVSAVISQRLREQESA